MDERRVSGSRLERAHLRLIVPNKPPSSFYFWAPSRTITSSRPGGSDRQVLEERRSLFSHTHKEDSLSPPPPPPPFFTTLLPSRFDRHAFRHAPFCLFSLFPRPSSPPSWRNKKSRLRSCSLGLNPTAVKGGPTERKAALATRIDKVKKDQNAALDRYIL
jgi:hypothetical protein